MFFALTILLTILISFYLRLLAGIFLPDKGDYLIIAGLIVSTLGAICLISPLVLSKKIIDEVSSMKLGFNPEFRKSLLKSRKIGLIGAIFILSGFCLQLIGHSLNLT